MKRNDYRWQEKAVSGFKNKCKIVNSRTRDINPPPATLMYFVPL